MPSIAHVKPDLELALLHRSLRGLAEDCERCGCCHRSLLIGEKVYEYATGALRCELCRVRERSDPADFRRVHGPEFGHTLKLRVSRSGSPAAPPLRLNGVAPRAA